MLPVPAPIPVIALSFVHISDRRERQSLKKDSPVQSSRSPNRGENTSIEPIYPRGESFKEATGRFNPENESPPAKAVRLSTHV